MRAELHHRPQLHVVLGTTEISIDVVRNEVIPVIRVYGRWKTLARRPSHLTPSYADRFPTPCSILITKLVSFHHSSMTSSEKSPRLSAPQTDHLFRFSLPANRISSELLRFESLPSASSFSPPAARCLRYSSSSNRAASSASGVSGMVSRELMEGERERNDVGVLGIEETDPNDDVWCRG